MSDHSHRTDRQKFLSYRVDLPTSRSSITVTFNYGDGDLRTLVALTRREAFAQARARWGDEWIGEPLVSSPRSIYYDVTGVTRERWQAHRGLNTHETVAVQGARRRREGRA